MKKRLKQVRLKDGGEAYVPKTRDDFQKEALNSWARKGFQGSIIAATGFGKSRVATLAIGYSLDELEDDTARCLVLVPTVQLQEQFPNEFRKWGFENYLDRIDFMCYQSAHKMEGKHYHVVICDEIHLGLSPVYREFFNRNTYDRLLCLTATIPEDPQYRMYLVNLAPICFQITLDECVEAGFVADYEIYCIGVDLEENERAEYDEHHKKFVKMRMALGYGAFATAQAIIAKRQKGNMGAAVQYMNSIRGRRQVVQQAIAKVAGAAEVADFYKGRKIITFGGTNKFTDRVAEAMNADSYHSGKTAKQREKLLDKFKSGEVKVLCSTKALNQGMDVPDVGIGIIVGLESKSLPMIQRLGRIIRKDGDKIGKIYIFYVKHSQEEKWMNEATKTLKNVQKGDNLKFFLS
jgi:superfamily II DNA or RNA helicase